MLKSLAGSGPVWRSNQRVNSPGPSFTRGGGASGGTGADGGGDGGAADGGVTAGGGGAGLVPVPSPEAIRIMRVNSPSPVLDEGAAALPPPCGAATRNASVKDVGGEDSWGRFAGGAGVRAGSVSAGTGGLPNRRVNSPDSAAAPGSAFAGSARGPGVSGGGAPVARNIRVNSPAVSAGTGAGGSGSGAGSGGRSGGRGCAGGAGRGAGGGS